MRAGWGAALAMAALIVTGCGQDPARPGRLDDRILGALDKGTTAAKAQESNAVNQALLPPLSMQLPQAQGRPIEARFDLNVSNAPAREVFLSIVSGTRYSMLVNPDVAGFISVNLKDVSIAEALDSIREVYGYEFKIDGSRIYIQPAGLQTRVFQVNYLTGARQGRSDMRVNAGSASGATSPTGTTTVAPVPVPAPLAAPVAAVAGGVAGPPSLTPGGAGALGGAGTDASRISTITLADIWQEIAFSLRAIVGVLPGAAASADGRSVIISPQSGVIVVRALPQELRNVDNYLKAMKLSVDRQVMIEAKIIDVTLSQSYQSGINWAAFPTSGISGGFTNSALGTAGALAGSSFTADSGSRTLGAAGAGLAATGTPGGVFGLAVQTQNFAALLQFLESQGVVQVLSSPRIAAINNQKAVLKVGADELFVTNISPPQTNTTGVAGTTTTTTPAFPVLGTLFSGISLDITPQIDDSGNITLHIHPLVSKVAQKNLVVDFGTGNRTFPVASAEVSESDTIVRARDGNIVVLGGLMKVELTDTRGSVPGLADVPGLGGLFRNTGKGSVKKELIILIKASIVHDDKNWEQQMQESRERLQRMSEELRPVPADRR